MTIQLTQVTNTGDKRGAGGTYKLAGDPSNFKSYHHVASVLVLPILEVYL